MRLIIIIMYNSNLLDNPLLINTFIRWGLATCYNDKTNYKFINNYYLINSHFIDGNVYTHNTHYDMFTDSFLSVTIKHT